MSTPPRWLKRLAKPGARLLPGREGGWAVYPGGDRRRRALTQISAVAMRAARAEGYLDTVEGGFRLSPEGAAALGRQPGEDGFADQHRDMTMRALLLGQSYGYLASG